MAVSDLTTERYRDFLVSAAADPEAWAAALHDISDKTRSAGAILFHRSAMAGTPVSRGVAEAMDVYWKENWIARDIRLRAIPTQMSLGLGTDEDCVSVDEMRTAPLYNDFLARFRMKWFAGVGFNVAGQMWCLSIQRSPGQGQFDASERKVLTRMSRMMADVGELNHLIAEAKTIGLTSALDRFGDYWITYDFLGRQVGRSEAGRTLSNQSVTLSELVHREPLASHFANTLAAVRGGGLKMVGCAESTVAIPGAVVTIKAIRLSDIHAGFGRAQYLVALRENRIAAVASESVLRLRYGLTQAEAALARAIAQGMPLREAAEMRPIAYETARAQLKSIFGKLGVHRQSELIALLRSG